MPKFIIDCLDDLKPGTAEDQWLQICEILDREGFVFVSRDKTFGPRNMLASPYSINRIGEAMVEVTQMPITKLG